MIASHQKASIPTVQLQMPPAIHVHPAELRPNIVVTPAENPAPIVTIETPAPQVAVNPVINVAPSTIQMPEKHRCSWRHQIIRDNLGRMETVISTPIEYET